MLRLHSLHRINHNNNEPLCLGQVGSASTRLINSLSSDTVCTIIIIIGLGNGIYYYVSDKKLTEPREENEMGQK